MTFGGDSDRNRERWGHVLAEFRVTEDGLVRDVRIVEDTLGLVSVRRAVRERLSEMRFRPRFEKGVPVSTSGVRRRFDIGQKPSVLDPPEEAGETQAGTG